MCEGEMSQTNNRRGVTKLVRVDWKYTAKSTVFVYVQPEIEQKKT